MDLSIAIVSWNTRDLLDRCLASLPKSARGLQSEVIVVDNASTDGTQALVRERHPSVGLIANADNAGFTRANNQALGASTGRHFLLLNPDTVCAGGALSTLVRFLDDHQEAGAVGPLVLNPDSTLQFSWARFPRLRFEVRGTLDRRIEGVPAVPTTPEAVKALGPFRTDWIGGCCMMVRREAIAQVGPMDERYFMYCEELDWCYRLCRAGWQVCVEPASEIIHFGGQSSMQTSEKAEAYLRRSKSLFFAKYHGRASGMLLGSLLAIKHGCKRVSRALGA